VPRAFDEVPAFTIRCYRAEDRDAVVELWRRTNLLVWYNDPDRDIALWEATPSAQIHVGELDGSVIATTCTGHDGHRGWLYYVAVHPDCQRMGLGRRMVRHAEHWLASLGVPKSHAMIRAANQKAWGFYENLGYRQNPVRVAHRWLVDRGDTASEDAAGADGRIELTITYLEMHQRPQLPPVPHPAGCKIALLHAEKPTVIFYRFLYDTVGRSWLWYERRMLDDEALRAVIEDERVEIFVLYVDGVPAGYAELDRRRPPDVELAYFGLMPEFIGRGLGGYLLHSIIGIVWDYEPRRLWVHTNTLDHPKALSLYQRMGFEPYKQERKVIEDPRLSGLMLS
jgi:GNAT superfamily N-acetyltransferase